jgi:hypothetical protein
MNWTGYFDTFISLSLSRSNISAGSKEIKIFSRPLLEKDTFGYLKYSC